jgi:hypothetical protein
MARYEDTCRECGRKFQNSHAQGLRYCSVGCEARAGNDARCCGHQACCEADRENPAHACLEDMPDWRALADELAAALSAFARQRGFRRAHSLGCLCEGRDGDGTTCLSRQDTARDALAKYEAAKK